MSDAIPLSEFDPAPDRMPIVLTRYQADRGSLDRLYTAPFSLRRRERFCAFYDSWLLTLESLPFDELTRSDRADYLLFRNHLEAEKQRLDREAQQFAGMEWLIPFAADLISLEDSRRMLEDIVPEQIAARLDTAANQVRQTQAVLEETRKADRTEALPRPTVAFRAAEAVEKTLQALSDWYGFYNGYDPLFTWWVERPYQVLVMALMEYTVFLRREIAGAEDDAAIVGDPLGRDDLLDALHFALIPYTPEELIEIAQRERAWCLQELGQAAHEMGFGEDWRAALEAVKDRHVVPGEQPTLIRDLAREAVAFLETHDLVTVPSLAQETWRMEMMSPEKQKVNPFFLGGEVIQVSYPTDAMEHPQKRMSLRGNNRHFVRATVQHELIPGHHLQGYSQERYRPYRRLFRTPFWTEGWTLHWEMLLWELDFPQTPQDRIGMLFWRNHRAARVVFSLGFHLGRMTPQECIDMLVNDVGHECKNAEAEVRRSFGGIYDPLYQCAYLIGGLQVHALYRELVGSGRMTDRVFHDSMMRENCMPIAVLRAILADLPLESDFSSDWRFQPVTESNTLV